MGLRGGTRCTFAEALFYFHVIPAHILWIVNREEIMTGNQMRHLRLACRTFSTPTSLSEVRLVLVVVGSWHSNNTGNSGGEVGRGNRLRFPPT